MASVKAVHEGTLASAIPGTTSKEVMRIVTAASGYDAQVRAFLA
jgi:hypothetical protein